MACACRRCRRCCNGGIDPLISEAYLGPWWGINLPNSLVDSAAVLTLGFLPALNAAHPIMPTMAAPQVLLVEGMTFTLGNVGASTTGTVTVKLRVNGIIQAGYDLSLTLPGSAGEHAISVVFPTPLTVLADDRISLVVSTVGWTATAADISVFLLTNTDFIGQWYRQAIPNNLNKQLTSVGLQATLAPLFAVPRAAQIFAVSATLVNPGANSTGTLTISTFLNGIDQGSDYDLTLVGPGGGATTIFATRVFNASLVLAAGDFIQPAMSTVGTGWAMTNAAFIALWGVRS